MGFLGTVLCSVIVTLLIVRGDVSSKAPEFVSIDSTALMLKLIESIGPEADDATVQRAVGNFARNMDDIMAGFQASRVVVFDASLILTGAPDITAEMYDLARDGE